MTSLFRNLKRAIFGPSKYLFYLYLIQDLDLLLPVLKKMKELGHPAEVFVSSRVRRESPRVVAELNRAKISWFSSSRVRAKVGYQPSLRGVDALVTAAETTAGPHRQAFQLVEKANDMGISTFTMQHGLENIGLTYFDEDFPPEKVDFASKTIMTWTELGNLDPRVPASIRQRCKAVGCTKSFSIQKSLLPKLNHNGIQLVTIFENLHWGRYSDEYRSRFLEDLVEVARLRPNITFLIKPHHAGQWLTKKNANRLPDLPNMVIADPASPEWEPFTAPALIAISDGIITTPSTTAFDAASMNKPVAIVANDLELPVYSPLSLLRSNQDWLDYIDSLASEEASSLLLRAAYEFRDRAALPGDGSVRAVETIIAKVSNPR